MEKVKIMKRVLIIVIGLIIALTMSNKVFAADNSSGDIFNDLTGNSSNNSSSDNTNTDSGDDEDGDDEEGFSSLNATGTTSNTNNTSNTNKNTNSSLSTTNTNTSNLSTTNRSVTNENTLAKTGLGESGSIITIILVISGISAVYSIKKVNEYKKL